MQFWNNGTIYKAGPFASDVGEQSINDFLPATTAIRDDGLYRRARVSAEKESGRIVHILLLGAYEDTNSDRKPW